MHCANSSLLEAAKQEVADFHLSIGAAGHRFYLLRCGDRRHRGVQKSSGQE
jgi:hypothetical protein